MGTFVNYVRENDDIVIALKDQDGNYPIKPKVFNVQDRQGNIRPYNGKNIIPSITPLLHQLCQGFYYTDGELVSEYDDYYEFAVMLRSMNKWCDNKFTGYGYIITEDGKRKNVAIANEEEELELI